MSNANQKENNKLVGQLVLFAIGMFGFGFALIPLYDIFCEVTGFRTQNVQAEMTSDIVVDENRLITVEFIANTADNQDWVFRPVLSKMQVHPGKVYTANYFAQNLQARTVVGTATPDVKPVEVNKHFKKLECFCFTQQDFAANEGREMPVQFVIDPALPEHIERMTLSYTFFVNKKLTQEKLQAASN
ncbi:MAG: cytochrome c oxidase assembly protein [Gammaproteobacteria bacterium]|nr:cytochrome c oxidase assembly protein [Gammaproteobacteria bacterium]NNC96820.1 cytochrome c oxidase assembly protein [Gammaproteobacteria bacterium]NNM12888.1 cytochrome c oxidase assembly protein [Gammaproteobacteria bacterium]